MDFRGKALLHKKVIRRKTIMAKKSHPKEEPLLTPYVPQKRKWFFKVGERFYKRMMPVPYVYSLPLKDIKNAGSRK
jgi:hypothetical protein